MEMTLFQGMEKAQQKAAGALVGLLLDDSGSMCGTQTQTIEGVNEYLRGLRQEACKACLCLFSGPRSFKRGAILDPGKIRYLTKETYPANGASTALYDSMAEIIRLLEAASDPGQKVMCVIVTDGAENSSEEFGRYVGGREAIGRMVKEKEAKGWVFVFLGANPMAMGEGKAFFSAGNQQTYEPSQIRSTMVATSHATSGYLRSQGLGTKDFFSDFGPSKKGKA